MLVRRTLMKMLIHKFNSWAGSKPAHDTKHNYLPGTALCFLYAALLAMVGCAGTGQSVDALFADANTYLADAQKAGAEEYAKSELAEATALLAEAEVAIANKDKSAQVLAERALVRARYVEALTKQLKAEGETIQLEAELEKASAEADQARQEREAAEAKLAEISPE